MKAFSEKRPQKTVALTAEMKVAEVVDTWPQTLETFVKMGFAPLQSKLLRNTIARNVTIRQAAAFRNVDLNILLLNLQNAVSNPTTHDEAFVDPRRLRFDEDTIPELSGDIRLTGLVPCPVRTLLIEQFDSFILRTFTANGIRVAWWLAAEGSGLQDLKVFVKSIARSRQHERFPDFFVAVGTELFLFEEFGRSMYESGLFTARPPRPDARPEFAALEDPTGRLQLQFVVLFSFCCRPSGLGDTPAPRTWFDLTEPRYRGKVMIPALNLPVMPDFLAALHYYLGDNLFVKFCQNVTAAMHPAQSSSRKKRAQEPGVFVTPVHFSKIVKAAEDIHVIPDDGMLAVPGYFAETAHRCDDATRMGEFLHSVDCLQIYWKHGTFVPNHRDIAVDIPLDRLIVRPWRTLHDNIPDSIHRQLLRNFRLDMQS